MTYTHSTVRAALSCSVMSNSLGSHGLAGQVPLSMGILQASILEWVAMPSSEGSSPPRVRTQVLPHCRQILYCLRSPLYSYTIICICIFSTLQFSSGQSLSRVRLFATPWTACSMPGLPVHHQLQSLLILMSAESVMPPNHLILCRPLLPPSICSQHQGLFQ